MLCVGVHFGVAFFFLIITVLKFICISNTEKFEKLLPNACWMFCEVICVILCGYSGSVLPEGV